MRETLAIIRALHQAGTNVLNNSALGYELARRGAYTFRGFDYANGTKAALEARIAQEQTKNPSNQGAQTNAREFRRTFIDFNWLLDDGSTTPAGDALLASDPNSDEERALLRTALFQLEIDDEDDGNFSRPVLVMLSLLRHAPTRHRAGLELALEARDSTEAELARLLTLYDEIRDLPSADRAARLGISEKVRANSVKIFPTLAKYAGLVTEDQAGLWRLTTEGLEALGEYVESEDEALEPPSESPEAPVITGKNKSANRRRRLTRGREKDADSVGQHAVNKTVPQGLTPDQQAEAQQRLQERTENHQEMVRYFAKLIDGGTFYEDTSSYDLAWVSDESDDVHLFEMKTIAADGDAQVTRAVGQLLYYAHFNIVAKFKAYPSTRTLIVNAELHEDLSEFLETLGIAVIKAEFGKELVALNPAAETMLELLPQKPAVA